LPWPTSQKGQRRVHISPIIINVAVPPLKHSPRLGQLASSHTVKRLRERKTFLIRSTSEEPPRRTLIQSGLRKYSVCSSLTGINSSLSASRSLTPASLFRLRLGGSNCCVTSVIRSGSSFQQRLSKRQLVIGLNVFCPELVGQLLKQNQSDFINVWHFCFRH